MSTKTIALAPVMFRYGDKEKTTVVTKTPLSIGTRVPFGKTKVSTYRDASAKTATITLNSSIFAMEKIVTENNKFLVSSDGGWIYAECEDDGVYTPYIFDGERVVGEKQPSFVSLMSLVLAYVSSGAAQKKDNFRGETKDVLCSIVSSYDAHGTVDDSDVYLLCDSIYYGFTKDKSSVEFEEREAVALSVQQAIDVGGVSFYDVLPNQKFSFVSIDEKATAESREAKKVSDIQETYEDMMKGNWYVPFEWDESVKKYIPSLSTLENYYPTKKFIKLAKMVRGLLMDSIERMELGHTNESILSLNCFNGILAGVPGTGKSILIRTLGAALGVPVYVMPFSERTDIDHLVGLTQIDKNGKLTRQDTLLLEWVKHGGFFIGEEINLASANLLQGVFGQLNESPYIVNAFNQTPIVRHPLSAFFGTMNTETQGTGPLNEAFANRAPTVIILNEVSENDFVNFSERKFGSLYSAPLLKWAYKIYSESVNYLCQSTIQAEDIAMALSQRSCFEILRQLRFDDDYKEVIKDTIFGTVSLYDSKVAEGLFDVLDSTIAHPPVA